MNAKVWVTILEVMLCTVLVAGCKNTNTPRVDQNVKAATDIRRTMLLKELDKKWENPPVHFELGQLYHAAGDYSKAEYHYNIALGFNPAYREVLPVRVPEHGRVHPQRHGFCKNISCRITIPLRHHA
jgi:lipoprotein NlpI